MKKIFFAIGIIAIGIIVVAVIALVTMFAGSISEKETSVPALTPTITPLPKTTSTTQSPEQPLAPLPYQVMDRIPEPGAKDVPVTTSISINFSILPEIVELEMEPEVEISNISREILTTSRGEHVFIDGGKVTFYLAKPLLPETNYTVKITYGVEKAPPDSKPTSTTTWQFTTSS